MVTDRTGVTGAPGKTSDARIFVQMSSFHLKIITESVVCDTEPIHAAKKFSFQNPIWPSWPAPGFFSSLGRSSPSPSPLLRNHQIVAEPELVCLLAIIPLKKGSIWPGKNHILIRRVAFGLSFEGNSRPPWVILWTKFGGKNFHPVEDMTS